METAICGLLVGVHHKTMCGGASPLKIARISEKRTIIRIHGGIKAIDATVFGGSAIAK